MRFAVICPSPAILLLLCGNICLKAQDGGGQADISPQQYYLTINAHQIANIAGLGLSFSQFIPEVGLISGSLLPAASGNRFRNGDSYLKLKGYPWRGQHWTLTAGDFHLRGQLLAVPFINITFPEIAARGLAIEAVHGGRTVGFFYGEGTISNTPRVVLRQQVPQTLMGVYWKQAIGERLLLGARYMHYSNNLAALKKLSNFVAQTPFTSASTLSFDSLYTVTGPLKLYGEATWSTAAQEGINLATRDLSFSTFAGPILETKRFTFRANYTFQNASYFPILGYYLGDRAGPFGEVKYRPFERLEMYASASEFENNVAKNPTLADFRSSSESAGASVQLPSKISLSTQFTMLSLNTRTNATSPWLSAADQQTSVTASRPFAGHNLRVTVRDFQDVSSQASEQQRSVEVEDNFHFKRISLGGGVKLQRLVTHEARSSMFYRGSAQVPIGKLSLYANFETGHDLLNRTLLATNTISTTIIGASSTIGKNWEFQAEAYRNNLLTELNPQSIFVLQGQGVFIPGTLAAVNQWSIYFRITRRFHWGKAGASADLTQYVTARTQLKGSVDGYVMERRPEGNRPADGVTVSMDSSRSVITDAEGRYRFPEVPEGYHQVALALNELPADFEVGKNIQSNLQVQPSKAARADFDVVRLGTLQGKVVGPKGTAVDGVVIRIQPGDRYTTPDVDGVFSFYNLRSGSYSIVVDEKTLPEFGALKGAGSVSVELRGGDVGTPVTFEFEVKRPEKRVRNVLDKK